MFVYVVFCFCVYLLLWQDLPYKDVVAGYQPPHEIVAVLRPGNYKPSSTGLPDQKYIVKDDELEMVMEVRYLMSNDHPSKLIHKRVKPSSHNDIDGLYVFPLREDSLIFSKSGDYQFIFSVVSIVPFQYGISCKNMSFKPYAVCFFGRIAEIQVSSIIRLL